MAAETYEFRDRIDQAVDREFRAGTFDAPLQGFYAPSGVRAKLPSRVLDTAEQFKAIDRYLGRLKDRLEADDASRAAILGQMTHLGRSLATMNARLEAVEGVLVKLRRDLLALERAMMNVPGESE